MVILAAGMGSRFGGPKQLVPIGPAGESILDYNAHDAARAGVDRIVAVTRPELQEAVGARLEASTRGVETVVALQHLPPGRTKPLGTTEAVLVGAAHVDGPFGVANADDLYGPDSFVAAVRCLRQAPDTAAVVGFPLGHTVPTAGSVSRALLQVGTEGQDRIVGIHEVHGISRAGAGWIPAEVPGVGLVGDRTMVSMNLWAFPLSMVALLREALDEFVAAGSREELLLPEVVGRLVGAGRARVDLVTSDERWSGLTNPDDVDLVRQHAAERWRSPLWA
jgi:molybdopterin-guanine dinucleotide biosynthesis protein A